MKANWKGIYQLLHRYQNDKLDPEKKHVMDVWYDSVQVEGVDLKKTEDAEFKIEMWEAIKSGMSDNKSISRNIFVKKWWQNGLVKLVAASVLLLIGFSIYKNIYAPTTIARVPDAALKGMLVSTNDSDEKKITRLTDGSEVTLEPGAVLYYPNTFSHNERKVFLKGNAFFEVTPNRSKPFLVYSDHVITKVVGTSFTIKKNLKGGSIEVAVITGVVIVRENTEGKSQLLKDKIVTLTANKKVTYNVETENLVTGLVEEPRPVMTEILESTASLKFSDIPLSVILPQLEKLYGIKIKLANPDTRNCTITADISQFESLFPQLDGLCGAIGASYKLEGEEIVISGPGCQGR